MIACSLLSPLLLPFLTPTFLTPNTFHEYINKLLFNNLLNIFIPIRLEYINSANLNYITKVILKIRNEINI
ncbi:hypothetical protein XSR1_260018 [Xenorhabdus szentirmaii DSM 16338]|uniref:Uncharacterized protein n=1 Tax=Xenorhabdus szentirmaii DSM 16338 TaxID=1427518 RepID=W1IWU9_9GAMM|nr:hypothetical protein XSR1_260018 [Xenorhabdus szentirmaii DSM 16338]